MISNKTHSPSYATVIPLMIILVMGSISITQFFDGSVKTGCGDIPIKVEILANPPRIVALGLAYFLAIIQIIKNPTPWVEFMKRNLFFVLMAGFFFSSIFWSLYPSKVIVNGVHLLGVSFSAFLFAKAFCITPGKILKLLNGFFVVSIGGSILTALFLPKVGLCTAGRWAGLFSHANWLGFVCMVGVWVALVSIIINPGKGKNIYGWITLCLSLVGLWGSESKTSLLISLVILLGFCMVFWMENGTFVLKIAKVLFPIWIALLLTVILLSIAPEWLGTDKFFQLIERDPTMTGRDQLWEEGGKAFFKKPILGWSFDSHMTVFNTELKNFEYLQFHNGYIDVAVKGGIVILGFLAFLLVKCFYLSFRLTKHDYRLAAMFLLILISIMLHNISEASFFRSTHFLWIILIFIFFALDGLNEQFAQRKGPPLSNRVPR
jgi:exopolysaccharide production protein ExoQ